MKNLLLSMLAIILNLAARSQVIITFQFPPSGVVLKSQLWNLALTSVANERLNVQLEMNLTDISNNQRVISAVTKTFIISKGMKQVRTNDLMPINYSQVNPIYNIDISPDGFLPAGVYAVCFSLIKLEIETSERIAEDCETIEVEPLSPPMLVSPSDNEEIISTRPFFTWLPPAPFNMFNNLRYDYLLTEMTATQTAAQAIQQNLPLLSTSFIAGSNLQYPASLPELDSAKTYAWQVTAKNNNSTIAKSEDWTFKVQKQIADTIKSAIVRLFVSLKKGNDASYVINDGLLQYQYLNELNDSIVEVKVMDLTAKGRKELSLDSSYATLKFGQNFIRMDLRENPGMTDKHIYAFEMTNSNNEKWQVKFECHKNPIKD